MTLDEAINHTKQKIEELGCSDCAKEHQDLLNYLLELKGFRMSDKSKTSKELLQEIGFEYFEEGQLFSKTTGDECSSREQNIAFLGNMVFLAEYLIMSGKEDEPEEICFAANSETFERISKAIGRHFEEIEEKRK